MTDSKKLHDKLNQPAVPKDLTQKIRSNWQMQLKKENNKRQWRPQFAMAAGLLLFIALFNLVQNSPAVVDAAYEDILADAKHNIGLAIPVEHILKAHDLNPLRNTMQVSMTKHCKLDGHETVHMQLTDAQQGEVHLFIYQGEFTRNFWEKPEGVTGDMPWKLVKPRKDLSVLVLQTSDANADDVENMIQHLFVS